MIIRNHLIKQCSNTKKFLFILMKKWLNSSMSHRRWPVIVALVIKKKRFSFKISYSMLLVSLISGYSNTHMKFTFDPKINFGFTCVSVCVHLLLNHPMSPLSVWWSHCDHIFQLTFSPCNNQLYDSHDQYHVYRRLLLWLILWV